MRRMFRFSLLLATSLVLGAPLLTSAQSAPSCDIHSALYGSPGSYTFTVPAGITSVRVVAVGAGGGGGAGAGGWGSGGGGGCGGSITGGTIAVTPGQKIPLSVGYGGTGGNGSQQCTVSGFPWCGSFYSGSNGASGGASSIGSFSAEGGGWGRGGFYNLYNQNAGGSGGGSGGGGGGNGWPGFYATPGSGGTAGGNTNSQGAGGYCTGSGWSIDPSAYIQRSSFSAGTGGYAPGGNVYWGGGGGGGLVISGSGVKGGDGQSSPGNGGTGFGGGGGGSNLDNLGFGGGGASGAVYVEWDGDATTSCALSCSVKFDQNPLRSGHTTIHWSSQNASLFYINTIGYVSGSGSAQVYTPGDYSGTVSGIGSSATCAAVLTDGSTTTDPNDPKKQCDASPKVCGADGNLHNTCGAVTNCRFGCSATTNTCNSSCTNVRTCDSTGKKVINVCDNTVADDCEARGLMCSAGICGAPVLGFEAFDATRDGKGFSASGHLQVQPNLVFKGSVSHVYWNVTNAAACTVTGSNGDGLSSSITGVWNTLFSTAGGKTSSAIDAQTTYTLHCAAFSGAVTEEKATVNVLPGFQEL